MLSPITLEEWAGDTVSQQCTICSEEWAGDTSLNFKLISQMLPSGTMLREMYVFSHRHSVLQEQGDWEMVQL